RPLHRRPRLPQRDLREPAPDRVAQADRRRRAADRQVQTHLSLLTSALVAGIDIREEGGAPEAPDLQHPPGLARAERTGQKSLTIGAVCKQLEREFPDISISKIRYLEDQKLLAPRRTQGGYRLYTSADVARLRTILRLQRDEFLPLRVIRQELAAGRAEAEVSQPGKRPDP